MEHLYIEQGVFIVKTYCQNGECLLKFQEILPLVKVIKNFIKNVQNTTEEKIIENISLMI